MRNANDGPWDISDVLSISLSREPGEDAGSYTITPTYVVDDSVELFVQYPAYTVYFIEGRGWYAISTNPGTLTIAEHYEITVEANSGEFTYDGTPKTVSGFVGITEQTDDSGETYLPISVNGVSFRVYGLTAGRTGTNVQDSGAVDIDGTATVRDANGNDVTSQFTIIRKSGTLSIKPRPIIIKASSTSSVYTGKPLTLNRGFVYNSSLAAGDTLSAVVCAGSQTVVGVGANTPVSAVIKRGDADVTGNYAISWQDGTLTVTPRTIEITAGGYTKTYDGTPLTAAVAGGNSLDNPLGIRFAISRGDLARGDSISALTFTGAQTDVGTSRNVPSDARIVNAVGDDVTFCYTIAAYHDGTLEILPRNLVITIDDQTKMYGEADPPNYRRDKSSDGDNAGVAPGQTIDDSRLTYERAPGEDVGAYPISVAGNGVADHTGETKGIAILDADGKDATRNYIITVVPGTLTITPVPAKYKITYSWENAPDGKYAQTLPTDDTAYVDHQPYTIDKTFTSTTTIDKMDDYGNVIGTWTFSGWDQTDGTIDGADIAVKGRWTYTEVKIETPPATPDHPDPVTPQETPDQPDPVKPPAKPAQPDPVTPQETPGTGDESNPGLWIALTATSFTLLLLVSRPLVAAKKKTKR